MSVLEGKPRLLSKQMGPAKILAGTPMTFSAGATAEGWEILPMDDSTSSCAVNRQYVDLAAYELEKLTFFIGGVNVQESEGWVGPTTDAHVIDLVSKVPILDDDLNHVLLSTTNIPTPGFSDSLMNMEQVIFCRYRQFYSDAGWSNTDLTQVAAEQIWGEGDSTAASRIYLTKIVAGVGSTGITAPQTNFQILGTPSREDKLPYLMRLKRSYELKT